MQVITDITMVARAHLISKQNFPLTWSGDEVARWSAIGRRVREAKDAGKRVVLVTGVFDVLHEEHVAFLQKARQAGNYLVVGVESDARVRQTKGPDRPHDTQSVRVQNTLGTGFADEAAVLPESFSSPKEHEALIAAVRPHILAISSHSPHQTEKREIVARYGGEVRSVHEHNPEVSTTQRLTAGTLE